MTLLERLQKGRVVSKDAPRTDPAPPDAPEAEDTWVTPQAALGIVAMALAGELEHAGESAIREGAERLLQRATSSRSIVRA
jgi:hypothetical protein